jgi:hypothetical protein
MALNYLDELVRRKIVDDIKSVENKERKRKSFKEFECYTDNLKKYVNEELTKQYSEKTKAMMPVVSSINLVKRIVNQQSTIYMEPPKREFTEVSEEAKQVLEKIYKDFAFDSKCLKLERIFNLQKQSHYYIRLLSGKFIFQPLYLHNLDVVESEENPEEAEAYIISNFDKLEDIDSDQVNQIIADKDDYKRSLERYTLWTKEYNFVFDGNGKIVGNQEAVENEIGIIPIIDVSMAKDFTYFVQDGGSLVNFAIDYNVSLSDLMFISKLQGFAQGAVSGDKEVLDKMTTVEMGPAYIVKLANSPDGNPTKLDFIQRGSDIQGSIQALEVLLSNFLTSMGIDPKTINGKAESTKYQSGVERLLAMVERFEAARSNYDLFQWFEKSAYEVIKAYLNAYNAQADILDPAYRAAIPEGSQVNINWRKVELVQGEEDKARTLKAKMDSGLISPIEAIMIDRNVDREMAEEIYKRILTDKTEAYMLQSEEEETESLDEEEVENNEDQDET